MLTLGLSFSHDASMSLVDSEKGIIGSISLERITGIKKDSNLRAHNIKHFIDNFGYDWEDIDCIGLTFYPYEASTWFKLYTGDERQPFSTISTYGNGHLEGQTLSYDDKLGYMIGHRMSLNGDNVMTHVNHLEYQFKGVIEGVDKVFDVFMVQHHMAHAASAYYTSPFDEAVVFTVDASMHEPQDCSGWYYGKGRKLAYIKCPGYMFGNSYDVATEFCGLGPGTIKAGSLMGLAAYGTPNEVAKEKWEEFTVPYFERDFHHEDHLYSDYIFGQISGRYPMYGVLRQDIQDGKPGTELYNREYQEPYSKEESDKKEVMDIAASYQYIMEKSLVKYSQKLYEETKNFNKSGNVCFAGGTFLNCKANYEVRTNTNFNDYWYFPACGDDGTALGVALYINHKIMRFPKRNYSNDVIMYQGFKNHFDLPEGGRPTTNEEIAQYISEGKIVCYYEGRSEFGPRALGHRSFLTDPRDPNMKDTLNSRVKFREWYRPFAPMVLEEDASEWFDMDFDSPFMLYTVPAKKGDIIPSAVHVDGTARVQTINKNHSPNIYEIISNFKDKTGVPVILNTSLNIKGLPIVETPDEAYQLFEESDVDVLVINGHIWTK